MLNISNIQIEFEDLVLGKSSFTIPEHCVTLIRGFSGSGKTVVLSLLDLKHVLDTKVLKPGQISIEVVKALCAGDERDVHLGYIGVDVGLIGANDGLPF